MISFISVFLGWQNRQIMRSTLALAVLICGCDPSVRGTSESLVGATNQPSERDLGRETIIITQRTGPARDHILSYELRPNDVLTVTYSLSELSGETEVAKDTVQLRSSDADNARKSLWRMRPTRLQGIETVVYPVGCRPPIDSNDEVVIVFADNRKRLGIFTLPHSCKDGNSAVARSIVREVISTLPATETAGDFAKQLP